MSSIETSLPMRFPQPGMPEEVRIYEVSPRDGLQAEAQPLSVDVKEELISRLIASGLNQIEIGSFVSHRRVPQMADASEIVRRVEMVPPRRHPVLVPNRRGLEDAMNAGVAEIAVFASVTESFSLANLGASRTEMAKETAEVVSRAKASGLAVRGYLSMVFGDPWEGEVQLSEVLRAAEAQFDAGIDSLSLGDTIGVGTPGHVRTVIQGLRDVGIPESRLALHAHDTYGQALANVYAALQEGVREFDSSAGGVGGCPFAMSATGNLATEDLVWMLQGLGYDTGVDLDALALTSIWLANHLGRRSPSRVVRAFENRLETS